MTNTDTTYNGWTNRSTWALALHLDNNEGDYTYWRERTGDAHDHVRELDLEPLTEEDFRVEATAIVAEELEQWLDELYDTIEIAATSREPNYGVSREAWSLLRDVGFDTSTTAINYHEIARHWVDEVAEEAGQ